MFSSFPTFLSFLRLLQHLVSTKSSSNLLKSVLCNPLLEIPGIALNKAVEPVRKQVLNAAQMILYMIDNDVNYCNMLFYGV